ncbi:MAG: PSD1 and planctomycete cytochrome C domain-containing protein [Planctomycetota bacterium]
MPFRPRLFSSLSLALIAAAPAIASAQVTPRDDAAAIEFFEKKVRPVLVDNCYNCHSADTNSKGGLRVDDRNGLLQGGNGGSAIVPGKPEDSLLIQAITYTDDNLKMPPKKQLTPEQIADLTQWVKEGAAWPAAGVAVDLNKPNEKYEKLRKEHWAWQALKAAATPAVADQAWARDDIDRFVLAKLEEKGLKPVADADKATLLRRVTFDLTGLPPTPEDLDAFIADSSPEAFEKVVDRLLGSSSFGERWGRHWLDVARYGESTGSSRNVPYPQAWRFRDYVIDAFNSDKPYDQFIREQIAGDLLPASTPEQKDQQLIATGFLALGVKDVNQRFKVRFTMDNIDEQIDTVSRSVLALTASCARCHDHKFDPIPTADYYALAGIFHSTDLCAGVRNKMGGGGLDYYDTSMLLLLKQEGGAEIDNSAKIAELTKAFEVARKEFQVLRDDPKGAEPGPNGRPKRQVARQKMNRLQAELTALSDPAAKGKVALGARDAKKVGDTEVRLRGEAEKLGPSVPRGFLSVLQYPEQPAINTAQSGRLELAQWLSSEKNPLTSRVLANRVWQHLFEEGLVRSVDNFGVTGDTPSHPELLDHLAARFVSGGWSVKKLVRTVVLSHAYQLSADAAPANVAVDPANRLVWRHSPRRLDAEEIRDATLAASGKLNLSRPDASPAKTFKVMELPNNGPVARGLGDGALASVHRSVYLPLLRGLTPISLEVFDFAEQGMVTGSRDTTTVATQALYLLNDPFVRRNALDLAERVLQQSDLDDNTRVTLAYRLTVGRVPTTEEVARAKSYLADYEAASQESLAATPVPADPSTTVAVATNTATDAAAGTGAPVASSSSAATEATDTGSTAVPADKPAPPALPVAAGADVAAPVAALAAGQVAAETPAAAAPKKPPVVIDPDEIIPVDAPVTEITIKPANAKTAAWASFCQALLGTAEFRYLK